MKIQNIETPALLLDIDIFNNNVNRIMERLKDKTVKLRPHFKTHKCTAISKILIEKGAKGITCSKLSEAEVLAEAGIQDILIANQIVDPVKIERLTQLCKKSKITVCVDCKENIEKLSEIAGKNGVVLFCLIEFDLGMSRCGVDTFEEVLELAKTINASDSLEFEGIQAYAGHNSHVLDKEKREKTAMILENKIADLIKYLNDNDVKINQISGGSTGTSYIDANSDIYTELQAGSFVYMDQEYIRLNPGYNCALTVLSSVISVHKDRIVTDTGAKSCTTEQGLPTVRELPEAPISLSEEHGTIKVKDHNYKLLDKIAYIPTHCCTTINLYDKMYIVRGDDVLEVYKVDGSFKSI
ncbi:MAG TPA: DSD1 family PLP-dependent enzyme [Clostridia bacterium]|nr:DSD1 family PLP-dependent enzyme [Clostridia bacterium]